MKIAVPIRKDNQIDEHFGHCEFFGVYTISESNEITETKTIESHQGCGCKSNIAEKLAENGVGLILLGGAGDGAINILNKSGINVIRGCSGDANTAVKNYISGKLMDSGSSCGHHDHEHGHSCNH